MRPYVKLLYTAHLLLYLNTEANDVRMLAEMAQSV